MLPAIHGVVASSGASSGTESFLFYAVITPLDYTTSNTITLASLNDYEVDWGDGSFTTYVGGAAAISVASNSDSGIITVRSVLSANGIGLGSNTFTTMDVQKSSTLSSALNMCTFISNLTSFAIDDTSNIADFRSMFQGCTGLTSLPAMDTSAGTLFDSMFNGCSNLVCLASVDTATSGTSATTMFDGATSMTAPTAGEQTDIATVPPGLDYVNGSACP